MKNRLLPGIVTFLIINGLRVITGVVEVSRRYEALLVLEVIF